MYDLSFILWIAFFVVLASFWWESDKMRSIALSMAKKHCHASNLQLLDQSVMIDGIWPLRDEEGTLRLRRKYKFEFTSTGEQRYQGTIILLGLRKQHLELEAYVIPDQDDFLNPG